MNIGIHLHLDSKICSDIQSIHTQQFFHVQSRISLVSNNSKKKKTLFKGQRPMTTYQFAFTLLVRSFIQYEQLGQF